MGRRAASLCVIALVGAALAAPTHAGAQPSSPRLKAGVGRADITPPTGFPFGGWVRADRVGTGHTRAGHRIGNHSYSHVWLTELAAEAESRQ